MLFLFVVVFNKIIMIVIGAKGFAKELLEDLISDKYNYNKTNLMFFDNISKNVPEKLYDFKILTSLNEVKSFFNKESAFFTIGIGFPKNRKKMAALFEEIGGDLTSVISKKATVGSFNNIIEKGVIIRSGVQITNDITIGKGSLINLNCTIGHDSSIGEFVELSPNVNISGHCIIGNLTSIGSGSTVLPNVKIGDNCIIGAGSVITKDIPNNSVVVGVPGKIIKANN